MKVSALLSRVNYGVEVKIEKKLSKFDSKLLSQVGILGQKASKGCLVEFSVQNYKFQPHSRPKVGFLYNFYILTSTP